MCVLFPKKVAFPSRYAFVYIFAEFAMIMLPSESSTRPRNSEAHTEDWIDPKQPQNRKPTYCKVFKIGNADAYLEAYLHCNSSEESRGVVKFYETYYVNAAIAIRMEYCPNGSLFEEISARAKAQHHYEEHDIIRVAKLLLATLIDLYAIRVAHRSIDPTNLLINADGDVRLTDFGSAKLIQVYDTVNLHTVHGQPQYASPEANKLWLNQESAALDVFKNDVWSLGKVLFEMATLKVFEFLNTRPSEMMQQSVSTRLKDLGYNQLVGTLTAMLACNYTERCTAANALAILEADSQVVSRVRKAENEVTPVLSGSTGANFLKNRMKVVSVHCEMCNSMPMTQRVLLDCRHVICARCAGDSAVCPLCRNLRQESFASKKVTTTRNRVQICSECQFTVQESGNVSLILCLPCSKRALN